MESYSVEAVMRATGLGGFKKAFGDAAKSAEGFEKGVGGANLTIGKLLGAVGITAAVAKGFQVVRNSINQAFGRIDTMEQFNRVMTVMTGSSKKADKVLQAVNDTVTGTAYGLDVAALATQNFVTSNMDVDKATDTVAAWGDAVAFYGDGSNETFATVSDALAKMVSKGKVQMDTMNRLTENGIPAMQIYADATGQSVEDVAETMSKGELDADKFISVMNKAMEDGTKNFGAIKGAAKEAGASWGASFDNMKAAVARGVVAIIESIDSMLTDSGLPTMREMVAEFGRKFESVLKMIAENIPVVAAFVKDLYEQFKPYKETITNIIMVVGTFVAAFATFNTIVSAINTVRNAFIVLNGIMMANPIGVAIALIAAAAALIYIYWEPISAFFANLWDGISDKAIGVWDFIKTYLMIAWTEITDFANEILTTLREYWNENGEQIMEAAQNVWSVISSVISAVMTGIQTVMELVWPLIKLLIIDTWNAIKNVITGALDIILGIVKVFASLFTGDWKGVWEGIKQILTGAVQLLWGLINLWFIGKILKVGKAFISAFKGVIQAGWNFIKSLFTNALKAITSRVRTEFNGIKTIVNIVMSFLRGFIQGAWNGIKSVVTGAVNGVKSVISRVFNSLKGVVSGAFNAVKNAVSNGIKGALNVVKNIASQFVSAGRNIVTSIAKGITGAIGKVTGAISNVTSKIRNFLPFSPAKEGALRDIMKIQIPQSIAKSIDRGKGAAYKAVDNLTDGMNDRMNIGSRLNNINGISTKINDQINTNVSVDKQPAVINVHVGNKRIASEIVDDISDLQNRKTNRLRLSPR